MTDRKPRPVIAGIAGGSGAGKTTIIEEVVAALLPMPVAVIHHDSYYRDLSDLLPAARAQVNFDHPAALDTSLLVRHVEELRSGRAVPVPVYDFATHTREPQPRSVEPAELILLEGILVLAEAELQSLLDLRIFVDADPDIRFIRRLERDVRERGRTAESVVRQYLETVRPMHVEFVDPSKRHADLVIAERQGSRRVLELIVQALDSRLPHEVPNRAAPRATEVSTRASSPVGATPNREEMLRRVPLFQTLEEEHVARLGEVLREVTFAPDERIVSVGEPGHTLYILLDGTVSMLYPAGRHDFQLARLEAGEVFGEMALLTDSPRGASVEALEPVRALALDKEDFQRIVRDSSVVALKLLEALSGRIRRADERMGTLKELALRDPLTGLLNRRAFHERLRGEVDRSHRYGGTFSLILLDLDHFKCVNDTFGHHIGDELLRWVGRLLMEHTRTADTPFRVGGEEFAVLAPATAGEVARRVAGRLVELVAEARPPLEKELRITVSGGCAAYPDHGSDADGLFHTADQALFRAKQHGRNRVCGPGD